jgi:hypothetical protein
VLVVKRQKTRRRRRAKGKRKTAEEFSTSKSFSRRVKAKQKEKFPPIAGVSNRRMAFHFPNLISFRTATKAGFCFARGIVRVTRDYSSSAKAHCVHFVPACACLWLLKVTASRSKLKHFALV